jgi:K+-transporting ATPase ATPase C chain
MMRASIVLLLFFTGLFGLAYPLVLVALPIGHPARVGQVFDGPREFWSRPSSGTPTASSGSNLGPTNPAFLAAVKARVQRVRAAHPGHLEPVPADLVTTSGSGLDPHLSIAAARYQAERVAAARGLSVDQVQALITQHTEGRFLGLFGEPRVDVAALNAALETAP